MLAAGGTTVPTPAHATPVDEPGPTGEPVAVQRHERDREHFDVDGDRHQRERVEVGVLGERRTPVQDCRYAGCDIDDDAIGPTRWTRVRSRRRSSPCWRRG